MAAPNALFDDYGAYHRDRRNLVCHEIGIPLIVLAVIALLRLVTVPGVPYLDVAIPAILATAVYYLRLGTELRGAAVVAIAGMVVLYVVARYVPWPAAIAVFAMGWGFQFAGHAFEGKAPAFLTNLQHLLVGPLWVAGHVVPSSASSSSAR